ncbi:unnamed protein product [Arctia plantaginis]|uniref:Uncharacterized protein n=1 Tax=Arctia plantaginis TaxID=874455 RepID=A0A8S0YR30_ARCPL|nr:unnamed protein product [Arctia plantaginis]
MFNEVLADRTLSAIDGKLSQFEFKETPEYEENIHTIKKRPLLVKTTNVRVENRNDSIVLHMIPDLPSPENKNDSKVNRETKIPETLPGNSKTQSKALEITGIVVGYLLAVMCVFYCWRLKKRAEVTKDLQLSRSAGDDYNRVKELTNQTESPEYEYIESKYNALNANQESSIPIRAPEPTPHSSLPSKNTRFQISQRGGIREMEQCRSSTNPRSGLECTHVENEYDYVYGVKKKCPCVAASNRGARKPLRRNGGAVIPHRVPAHQ